MFVCKDPDIYCNRLFLSPFPIHVETSTAFIAFMNQKPHCIPLRCSTPELDLSKLDAFWKPPPTKLGQNERFCMAIRFDVQVLRTMMIEWDKVGIGFVKNMFIAVEHSCIQNVGCAKLSWPLVF